MRGKALKFPGANKGLIRIGPDKKLRPKGFFASVSRHFVFPEAQSTDLLWVVDRADKSRPSLVVGIKQFRHVDFNAAKKHCRLAVKTAVMIAREKGLSRVLFVDLEFSPTQLKNMGLKLLEKNVAVIPPQKVWKGFQYYDSGDSNRTHLMLYTYEKDLVPAPRPNNG